MPRSRRGKRFRSRSRNAGTTARNAPVAQSMEDQFATSTPEACAAFVASLLGEMAAMIGGTASEELLLHLLKFHDILLQLQHSGEGEYRAAPAPVRESLEQAINMTAGVAGIKPARKKMQLLLRHQLKLAQLEDSQQRQEETTSHQEAERDATCSTAATPRESHPSIDVEAVQEQVPGPDSDSDEEDSIELEDPHAGDNESVWELCKADGEAWGGRGKGGRGIARHHQCVSVYTKDIILRAVSLSIGSTTLLDDAELRIVHGHRYGLIGDNGTGKSTLLRQLSKNGIPGQPLHLRCLHVKQEISVRPTDERTCIELLLDEGGVDVRRKEIRAQISEVSDAIDNFTFDDAASEQVDHGLMLASLHERMTSLEDELSSLCEDKMGATAEKILRDLGFSDALVHGLAAALSGGWRMRLAIAQAFLQRPDVLLLDEPTNHLDLDGVLWLQKYLTCPQRSQSLAVVVVSHDRAFLQAVATDIIVLKDKKLSEFAGTIAEYYDALDDNHRFKLRLLDQRLRQETKAQRSIQKAQQRAQQQTQKQGRKGGNTKVQKQLKHQKQKMGRIGLYREDGKRYKQHSLKKMDESYIRLASKISGDDLEPPSRALKFTFGEPASLRSMTGEGDLVSTVGMSCGYKDPITGEVVGVLHDVTFSVPHRARVALVGPNGAGKSTLVKVLHREIYGSPWHEAEHPCSPKSGEVRRRRGKLHLINGAVRRATGVRTALVQQHHIAALGRHARFSSVEYLVQRFGSSSLEARTHLSKFGLVDSAALTKIGALSGGQQMRLYLATVFFNPPHLLILDEPTNHLDMAALDALGCALERFQGAVVVISHNQHFCSQFCTSLYEVDKGGVVCVHSGQDRASFDSMFSKYKARLFRRIPDQTMRRGVDMTTARNLHGLEAGAVKRGVHKVPGARRQTALL